MIARLLLNLLKLVSILVQFLTVGLRYSTVFLIWGWDIVKSNKCVLESSPTFSANFCGREGLVMLQAVIEITYHDHSTTAWVGCYYILLRYLVFVFVVRFLFIRWFPCIRHGIVFWGFPHVMVHVPLHNQLENPKPTLHCKSRPTPHATSPQGEFLISCSIKPSTHIKNYHLPKKYKVIIAYG